VPMQPLTDAVRPGVTAAQVRQLLEQEEALTVQGGLEIVDIGLNVIEDISADLAGGNVERQSYATMHGTARLRITRTIDWGGDLLRPYIIIGNGGSLSARFNLGVYHPTTPDWPLEESPPTFDVDGYDILLRLNQPVGDAYSIAAGQGYLATVEEILLARGYTQYVIDWTKASTVAPSSRVWAFADNVTWLTVVNDLLGSIGYAGIWSDWNGRLRAEQYVNPVERGVEWTYSDDQATTMMSTRRTVSYDYFSAPNRWVVYQSNVVEGVAPVEGAGIYTYTNESTGDTSVLARRGLIITRVEGVDVADQASLIARAQSIIGADMAIPTTIAIETSPNPLHWHFDRLLISDNSSIPVGDVMCTQWSLPLPPDSGDMVQQWKVLVR
jgi:hypothetical protein